jgi:membrane protease YdiL (CAAX protease family)
VTDREATRAAAAVGRTALSPVEATIVVGLCFGLAIWNSFSVMGAGFTSEGFSDAAMLLNGGIEVALGAAALFFLSRRGYAVATVYPAPTAAGTLVGIALYVAIVGLDIALATVLPGTGAGDDQPIARMVHASHLSLQVVVPMALLNGAFEEVFLLGVLMRGLLPRFGVNIAFATMLLVRLLYHLYQGPAGAVMVLGLGALLGLFYLRTGRLWPVVFAHVLCDIVPFVASGAVTS